MAVPFYNHGTGPYPASPWGGGGAELDKMELYGQIIEYKIY